MKVDEVRELAFSMRKQSLQMAFSAGKNGAHLGGGFSCMELLATLFSSVLRCRKDNFEWEERDRFYLSKGHAVLAYYTALHSIGAVSDDDLKSFETNGGDFPGHPMLNLRHGIEISSGSLGMGISIAVGSALAAKLNGKSYDCYVLVGDGESNEGSVWEAAMTAAHYKLNNLIVLLDWNHLQSDDRTEKVLDMGDMASKWKAFGWETVEIDGHDIPAIYNALTAKRPPDKPYAILARTVKGKGVSFLENQVEWHHGILTEELRLKALEELERNHNAGV